MEVLPGIHRIDGVIANVYLLIEPQGLTLIDTGMPGSARKILDYVRRIGHSPHDITTILLTHQHVDHVGGAEELARTTGADVLAHPLDAPAIEGKARRDVPSGPLRLVFRVVLLPRLKPVRVAAHVTGGETLPMLQRGGGLRVVATPGHTYGEVSYYVPGRKLLIAGDAYRHSGGRIVPSPNMFNRDRAKMLRSIVELADLEVTASLCGHGEPILQGAGTFLAQAAEDAKCHLGES
ncbi:MAG TPA: MBL fold metallo-hydrolase [Ktedonobacterales bacterium]|nr:MBL fold metallo-hydrolase [Ktedonobacterales bacterium]